jgi:hypothetical protein
MIELKLLACDSMSEKSQVTKDRLYSKERERGRELRIEREKEDSTAEKTWRNKKTMQQKVRNVLQLKPCLLKYERKSKP